MVHEHEGFLYKINKTYNGKRYYVCATPNVYCDGTAVRLENGITVVNKPHRHDPYCNMYDESQTRQHFRSALVERSRTETIALRTIYYEESIRNPHAATLYSWPTAEPSMRHARRIRHLPLPATLHSEDEIQNDDVILNVPMPAVEDDAGAVDPQLIAAEINIEPEVNNIEDYDMDFILPEDRELDVRQQLRNDADGKEEITFVEVPPNLYELYPPVDETNICIVCRMEERTHALVPCGHRVLCVNCVTQLQTQRCPLCYCDFNMALRIW
ncbi:uncharacterized protein LOC100568463 isoform X2 [Acyrthosiphon pisum]|uniref:RING-type domain-containing protein n=1 Tax=Acyrthosiphon pisum TaxID=7029 RepID=A0A8R1W793_ACYPI|nr:uncharacterized protein LOC100568463 isoform X2 [Acyrthosiphon pisum]|eukprot:XP_003240651.1 PREDICTED: uncharacterized protein LOC100568463 isoform X2 [Acyrthosiphon pisum]